MSESNQFEEIEDILKYLLKQEFINPDDIDLLAQKFKTTFLTIENKDEFFPFLNRFLQEVEGNDMYHEERVEALKTEIESFYDRIGTIFSVYHVAGYKDPNDADNSEKFSDEDDNFEFHNKDYLPPVFGPNIPDDKKPLVKKVIEKIASLYDQKQTRRQQVLQRWRQLRLANQILKLKKQAPAFQILQNISAKPYNSFYRIKEYVELINKEDSEKIEQLMSKYEGEIQNLRNELAKAQEDKLKNGLQMQKDKDLEKKIAQLQDDLQKRLMDNEKLKSLFENQKKELNDMSKEDRQKKEQLEKLNNLLQQLEKRKKALDSEMENKANSLQQLEQALKLSQSKIDELMKDKESWKLKYEQKDLKSFQKIRYFIKIMNLFKIRLMAFGFMKIFKRKEKAKISLMNVTQRIKARLLIQTRNIYCGQDIMKSYLKWMLKSRPDFIRESISKIPLTGRINQQVSFWRMKKLVFKPIVKKLSESAKALRRLKGFFLLHKVFKNREFLEMYHFLMKLNPNHRNTQITKVENVFQKFADNRRQAMRDALKKLIKNRDFIKDMLRRMMDKNYNQMRAAFWIMRMQNRQKRQMNEMLVIQGLLDRMARNKRDAYKNFMDRFKDKNGKALQLIQKLIDSQRGKQINALSKLKKNKNEGILDDMKNQYVNRFKEMMKQGSAKLLRDNLMNDAKKALDALRKHNQEEKRRQLLGDNENEKLKKFFQNLNNKKMLLKNSALNKLRNNHQLSKEEMQRKRNLLDKIKQRMDLLKRNTFNQLRENNNRENKAQERQKNQLNNMFEHLARAHYEKQKQSVRKIMSNNDLVGRQNQKLKNLLQRRLFNDNNLNKRRALNNLRENLREGRENDDKQRKLEDLAKMLKNGLNRKLKNTLLQLVSKNRQLQHGGELKNMMKKNIIQKLLDANKLNKRNAFQSLLNNKNKLGDQEQREKELMRKVFLKGDKGVLGQMKRALDALRNNRRNLKNKIVDSVLFDMMNGHKRFLKKYFDALRNFNRLNRGDEEKKKAKRNEILRKFLFGNDMKKGQAFNKLRENKYKDIIRDLQDKLNKSSFLSRLIMAQNAKVLQQFYRLIINNKVADNQYQQKLMQNKKFMNFLLNLNEKKKQAFNALKKLNKEAKDKQQRLRNIMGTLLNNQDSKLRRAYDKLVKNKLEKGASGNMNKLITQFEQLVNEKKLVDAFAILKRAQEIKQRTAVQCLKRNKEDEKQSQMQGLFSKNSPLSKMMRKLFGKYRQAFNALKKNKGEQQDKDKEALKEMKARLKVFGVGDNVMDALLSFADVLKSNSNKPYKSSPKDRFLNLVEYMENNDPDERYQQFLDSIARGEIQNPDDIKKIASKMNQAGKYSALLKQIKNPHLEMHNLKKWLEMNNDDGKYNHLLAEMNKNPEFNKLDLLNYLEKASGEGRYDKVKARMNFDTKADDLIHFMKKKNQPGTYTDILESQIKMAHPKLTSLANYAEQKTELLPLKDKINEIQAKKQLKKLVEYMKRNNGDGRYNEALKHLASKKQPRLSDLASFIKRHPTNQNEELLQRLNMKQPPLTQRAFQYFNVNNGDGKYNNLIKKVEGRNNMGIVDFYRIIADMKGDHINDLQDYLDNPVQVKKQVSFMNENNADGNYEKILEQMRWKPNPSLVDLLKAMMKYESSCDIKDLISKVGEDFNMDELADFLRRKNLNNKYNSVLKELSSTPNLFEFFKYLTKNKRTIDYLPIFDKIDGHEEDSPSPLHFLESKMKENKNDHNVAQLQRKLNIMRFPSFTKCMETIIRNPQFDELIKKMNAVETPEQFDRLNFFFQNNAQNPDFYELRQMLVQKKPLSDLFNYVEDNESKLNLLSPKQILNQDYLQDPLDECLKQINSDNLDGKYNDLLEHLKNIANPTIKDIVDFISSKGNPNGKYDDLLNKLNQKDLKDRYLKLLEWIADNNENGVYNDLNDYLNSLENPKLSDILKYASKNNKDGKYNPLLERILGRKVLPKKLIELLLQHNRKGKYDSLIKFLEQNPTATLEQIIDELEKQNANGDKDKLLSYIMGENDDFTPKGSALDQLLKQFLASGDFPELEEFMKKNKVKSPFQLLKWLEEDNADGKYNDLIKALKEFIQQNCSPEKGVNRLGIPQAHKQKMRECLQRLRQHNKNKNLKKQEEREKIRSMFISANKNMKLMKMLCLNRLRNHKNEALSNDQNKYNSKRKYILKLIQAQIGKMTSCMIKMHQNNNQLKEMEKEKNEKFGKVLLTAENKYKNKQNQILETMRNRNRLLKEVNSDNAKRLREAFHKKMKEALDKLRENNRKKNLMDKAKKNLFNKLMASKYKDSLKKYFDTLRNNNKNWLSNEEKKKSLQNALFKNSMKHQLDGLKKYFDLLRENKKKAEQQEQMKDRIKAQLMNALQSHSKDALKRILDKLRRNNNEMQMSEAIGDKVKKQLLKNLKKHSKDCLRKYFDKLRENNRLSNQLNEEKNKAAGILGKKLLSGGKDSLKKVLDALRRNNMRGQLEEMRKNFAMQKLMEKLKNGLDKKKGHCVAHLMDNRREDLGNKKRIKQLLEKLFDRQNGKLKECLNKLVNNSKDFSNKERRDRDRLRKILQKAHNNHIQRPFYKLIENCLHKQKQEQLIKGKFGDMDKNWKLKDSSTLNKIYRNYLQDLLLDARKRQILKTLIESQNNKKKQALLNMTCFIYSKKNKTNEAVKVIRKNLMQDLWYFYRILKMNKFLKDRNQIQQKLNSMVYCLRKNHKHVMRQALNKWAGTDIKNRVRLGTSKLETIILRREHGGYHSIKKYYLYMKFEKFIQGLMKLITLMDGKVYLEKEHFMNQLLDRNLWFQRVIDIWTIKSLPNHQIAFWKMRYAKDLKQDGVSAEKALKLKKLIHMMNMKCQGVLSHGFWKIHANSAQLGTDGKQTFANLLARH